MMILYLIIGYFGLGLLISFFTLVLSKKFEWFSDDETNSMLTFGTIFLWPLTLVAILIMNLIYIMHKASDKLIGK